MKTQSWSRLSSFLFGALVAGFCYVVAIGFAGLGDVDVGPIELFRVETATSRGSGRVSKRANPWPLVTVVVSGGLSGLWVERRRQRRKQDERQGAA